MKLELDKINKSFGANHVLKDVSFSVNSGRAFGLLGRNGSGKTTILRIITKFFPSDSGTVTLNGEKADYAHINLGYLPEERGLYPKIEISKQMAYLGELRGVDRKIVKDKSLELLKKLDAEEYYNRRLDTLSKGNQQKIQLAIALINDPDIVILDEPFSGLDPVNASTLKSLVREIVSMNKMVLFSSHQMSNVEEFCDDICIINHGKIILSGDLKQIKRSYPRTKIIVTPEYGTINTIIDKFKTENGVSQFIESYDVKDENITFILKDEKYKKELFNYISALVDIDNFITSEPSLEQIFVEKAGAIDNE